MKTIAACLNFFNEIDALAGWLESAARWADEIVAYQAGPNGEESDDGSVELLQKWKIPIHRGSINEGFGIVRTAAVRACRADYVMILDADERFYHLHQVMDCAGESTPPNEEGQILQEYDTRVPDMIPCNWENVGKLGSGLTTSFGDAYNQGAWLKDMIQHGDLDAVCSIRRHWHDFTFHRPTQNWKEQPDYQRRIIRNHPSVHWDANTRMHERLIGASNVHQTHFAHGPFFDHYHFHFKRLNPAKRAFAIQVYDAIHLGRAVPSWREFRKERGL